jgi:hypothetical protein
MGEDPRVLRAVGSASLSLLAIALLSAPGKGSGYYLALLVALRF